MAVARCCPTALRWGLLLLLLSVVGARKLQAEDPPTGGVGSPISQIPVSVSDLPAQARNRLSFISSLIGEGGSGSASSGVTNFAAATVPLTSAGDVLGGSVVTVKIGSPAVTLPVLFDVLAQYPIVQGPNCAVCPGSTTCLVLNQNALVDLRNLVLDGNGGQTSCPYTGANYFPSLSSTAVTPTCAACSAAIGQNTCLGLPFDPPNTCEFALYLAPDIGGATGELVQDTFSIGPISTGSVGKIFIGTTVFQGPMGGQAGVLGFGRFQGSLPFQLRRANAAPSAAFSVCLAAGAGAGGSLSIGGVPTQPGGGLPYPLAFVDMVPDNLFYRVPPPTNVLVNGIPLQNVNVPAVQGDWYVDTGLDLTLLPTALYTPLFDTVRRFSGCPNVYTNGVGPNAFNVPEQLDFVALDSECSPPLSANPSFDEVRARFPLMTLVLPGGVKIAAEAKSYLRVGNFGPGGKLAASVGLYNIDAVRPGDVRRLIGKSFLTDNLVVFDNELLRIGIAPVDCNTMQVVSKDPVAQLTPAPTTPAPTTPAPTTPAPTTPAPTTPAPTTPAPTTPAPTTPAPTTPAPTTPAPTTPAPTTPAPTTPSPTTPAPTTPAPTTPAPTTPAPTTPAPTTPAPTTSTPTTAAPTPVPTTGVFPAGGICDAFSPYPNQCFSSDGSRYTCCPVGVSCAQPPSSIPRCVGFASSADSPTPTNPLPTTNVPSPTIPAPTTLAPTTTAPTTPAPTTTAPANPPPTTSAPIPGPTASSTTCDPLSAKPNQCFNAPGSAFTCCPGACTSSPGDIPACA